MNFFSLRDFFKRNRLLVLLSFLIIFLLSFNIFGFLYLQRIKKRQLPSPTPVVTPIPPLTFTSPVKSEHLQTIPEYAADADHLVFFLPEETPVYAVFEGTISRVVHDTITPGSNIPFESIRLEKEGMTVNYLVYGETLVEEDDFVSEGEIIAKTESGIGPGCLGGGNLGVYLFKNGEPVELTKEMIRTGKNLP